ncbi:hypothetical protein IGI04_004503 [Brassica rapa subsp. trilocularis]|uniref:GTD-binding domain-containing protein n=1 Tax=Brassica rapa subsp. trilocularis TaxID=1813537 RepID=A0ABQ7NBB8_BRACM|nr:hypothetical protein IGI04_004503 [Brassica rapa subsp. trilocularis]
MESGKSFGTEDVSRSCESGWTMYLASHSHDPDDDCYYEDGDDEDSDGGESMDSDASSDRQAAREKTQWEAKTLGARETKLEDNLDSLQGDISSFTRDDVDETELRRLEDARLAYVAAVSNAKERQDEESLAMAAKARAYLQSLAFRY